MATIKNKEGGTERRHNETYLRGDVPCMDCGTESNIVWSTQNVFWNAVMKGVRGSGILCVYCFVRRAEKKFDVVWLLLPQFEWKKKSRNTL